MKKFIRSLFAVVAMLGVLAGQAFAFDLNPSVSVGATTSGGYTARVGAEPLSVLDDKVKLGVQAGYSNTSEYAGIGSKQDLSVTGSVHVFDKWFVNASAGYGQVRGNKDDYLTYSVGGGRDIGKHWAAILEARRDHGLQHGNNDAVMLLAKYSK